AADAVVIAVSVSKKVQRWRRGYVGRNRTATAADVPLGMPFLVKEEPSHYNYDEFVRDGGTTWSGVKNPVAQKHLRAIKKGDQVFYYHTGDVKAIVGIAKATSDAYPDPADETGKAHVFDLAPVKKLARPVTLA